MTKVEAIPVRRLVRTAALACFAGCLLGASSLVPAAAQEEPPWNTPIAAWYQPSWKAFLDMKAKAHGGTKQTGGDMPDWWGIRLRVGKPTFDPKQPGKLSDGLVTADLTPLGIKTYREELARVAKGDEWDPISACLPSSFPRTLSTLFGIEWVDTPRESYQMNENVSEVRRIYTDGRGHIPMDEAYPLWEGDAIGFWDGDTLVAHTINLRPNQYKRSQPYYSGKISTLERIRKVNDNDLEDAITIWDPAYLAKPWHVVQIYRRNRSPDARIDLWSCEENANVSETASGGTKILLPGDPGYRSPESLKLTPDNPDAGKPGQ